MKATLWMLFALLAAVMIMAGCPRTEPAEGDGTAAEAANTPPANGEIVGETIPDPNKPPEGSPEAMGLNSEENTGLTQIVFETTKGKIVMALHPEWSPKGVEHFVALIDAGYYNGAPWFRVVDGFVAQCGIAADPALNEQWGEENILDEPVVQSNKRGFVAFGKSMAPDSRTTHIFINLVDNSAGLDPQGFACFAEVIVGMDVVDSLTRVEYNDQAGLAAPGGLEKFKTEYPNADYILQAYPLPAERKFESESAVTETSPAPGTEGGAPGQPGTEPPAAPPAKPEGGM